MKSVFMRLGTSIGVFLLPLIIAAQSYAADSIESSSSVGFPILSLIIFSPLLGALFAILLRNGYGGLSADIATFVSSLLTLGVCAFLLTKFDSNFYGFQFVEKLPWIDRFGINYYLGIDGVSLFLVMVAAFLLPSALLATWKTKEKSWAFQVQIMMLQIGILGSFMALDSILFYTFFELMLVPLYFMIGIWGGSNRIYATTKFFIYTVFGSLLLLASLIYTGILYHEAFGHWSFSIPDWYQLSIPAATQMWLFIGFCLAFAIKAPLFPFHTWLPDAHYEAPTLGSVELAGLLLKLGPYGIIRFVIPLFPDASDTYVPFLIYFGLIGIIYGGLVAMVQQKLKKLIAYSSVAHMGYIVVGIFVFNVQGLAGGLIQMVNHALVTGALFLCVGMIYGRTHTQEISEYGGVVHTMPIFSAFFLFFSLASIGLPGLNGFVGELMIMLGAARLNVIYAVLAASGVIVAAVYMLWMYQRVIFGPVKNDVIRNLKDLTPREIVLLLPLAISTLVLGVYPQPFFERVNATLEGYVKEFNADEFHAKHKFDLAAYWEAKKSKQ
ncbi:MAG: NADH-quinone oxidoreductase subunit M [SAR324 cluster bacterium]|nr:NADH-quinone oxidoreductase subunit M [SAR324 cluster bacterium]